MKVKALRSFSGVVSMSRGQEMDIQDEFILNDLMKAGYVEPLEENEEDKPKKKSKKDDAQ